MKTWFCTNEDISVGSDFNGVQSQPAFQMWGGGTVDFVTHRPCMLLLPDSRR